MNKSISSSIVIITIETITTTTTIMFFIISHLAILNQIQSNLKYKKGLQLPHLGSNINKIIFLPISVLLIITTIIIIAFSVMIFNQVELASKNSLKTPFSYSKILEYLGIIILVLSSYSNQYDLMIIVAVIFTLYMVYNIIKNFPYPSSEISLFYLSGLTIFIINLSLYIYYTSENLSNQNNFLFISILLSTLVCAFNHTIWDFCISIINRYNIIFRKNKDITQQLLFFTTILELKKNSQKNEAKYVELQGLVNQHQGECRDINCPCLSKFIEEKYKTSEQRLQEQLLEQQAQSSVALQEDQRLIKSKSKGIYLYELSQCKENYLQWILEFIDYHFSLSIKNSKYTHYLEEFCIKYWYFQCKERNNSIKCLYLVKHHTQLFPEKSIFFRIVEMGMTQLIENKIKEKDKSLRYSYRLKDTQEAIMYERFENFVICEEKKVIIKDDIISLIQKKVQYNEKLIEGYNTISELYDDIRYLMININKIEKLILAELRNAKENIHFMRMLSLIKQRLVNDPQSSDKLETMLYELKRRDEFQDKNIVHSLTVLKGNVVSVIASFGGKEKGLILNFSERTPQFFGYQANEFYQINSVKFLMPFCVSKEHDLFIHRLIEQGTHNILRSYRTTLAKKKDGFLFPIRIYVNYYFGLQNDLCFSSLILKLSTNSHYMLIDQNGYIQGVSEQFYKPIKAELYEYECDNLDIIKSNIRFFCPSVYQLIEKNTDKQDITNFRCELYFPRRIQEILKNFQQELMIFENQLEKSEFVGRKQKQHKKEFLRFMNEFLKKHQQYYENTVQFELSLNLEQEIIQLIDGRQLILYVMEITQFTATDKDLTSTLGTTQATKTTVFQKILSAADDITFQKRQTMEDQINEDFINSQQHCQINIMASQFTVKKIENNYTKEDSFIHEVGLPSDREIEFLQTTNRQLPQHQIISSNSNIQGNNCVSQQQLELQNVSNIANQLVQENQSKRVSIEFYQDDYMKKVFENLDKQRAEVLKEIIKDELYDETHAKKNKQNNQQEEKEHKNVFEVCENNRNQFKRQNSENLIVQLLLEGPEKHKEYQLTHIDPREEFARKDTRAQMLIQSSRNIDLPSLSQMKQNDNNLKLGDMKLGSQLTAENIQSPSSNRNKVPQILQNSTRKYSLIVNPLPPDQQSKQISISNQHSPSHSDLHQDQFASHNALQTNANEITQGNMHVDLNNSQANLNESNMLNRSNVGVNKSYLDQIEEGEINVNNDEFTEETGNVKDLVSEDEHYEEDNPHSHQVKVKNQRQQQLEDNAQASVNSSEMKSTLNTQIKCIHQKANSNQSPLFLQMLFSLFVIQWFLFVIMISVQLLIIFQNFNTIEQNMDRILLLPQTIIPLSKIILSLDFQIFANENLLNSTQLYDSGVADESTYFFSEVNSQYTIFEQNLVSSLQRQILFSYQTEILEDMIDVLLTQNSSDREYNLSVQQILSQISTSAYHFSLKEIFNKINSQNNDFDTIQYNFSPVVNSINQINQDIYNSISSSYSNFSCNLLTFFAIIQQHKYSLFKIEFNGINLGVALVIIITSYIFILPSFQQVNKRLQDILKLICRISEKEAQDDIHMLNIFQEQLQSFSEEYLTCSIVVNLERNVLKQKSFISSTNIKKQRKIGQYLCDRIKEQSISQTSFCLLLLLLFLICSIFFIAEFILLKVFIQNTKPPSDTFFNFYVSSSALSTSVAAHNLLFKHQVYSNKNGSPYFSSEIFQNLTNLYQQTYNQSLDFFSDEFLKLKDEVNSLPVSFQNEIQFLQTNTPCSNNTYSILTNLEEAICLNALSGTVNKGLSASLQTVFAYMFQMKVGNTFDYQYAIKYLNSMAFKENQEVMLLNITILQQLILLFKDNILSVINSFSNLIIIVFAIGAIIYSIFFFKILIQFLNRLFTNFKLVRKGIMLIPYKRVCEDNNTLSLIKKYI